MPSSLWRRWKSFSTLGLPLFLLSCSGSQTERSKTVVSADAPPGAVLVDVLEGGQPEHYWQYKVQPAVGVVSLVREEIFEDYKHRDVPRTFSRPAGSVPNCSKTPGATSPNGTYQAYCSGDSSEDFYVADNAGRNLHHWSGKEIRGFAWAPNSLSVAILAVSGHAGMSPRELLSFISGHPVPHDTVFLELLDIRSGKITEYVVRRDVISSFTRILNWSEQVNGAG